MNKSKALVAALSVVAIAGMTACSKDRANPAAAVPSEASAASNGLSEAEKAKKALLEKMASYQEITANLQAIVDGRYSDDRCSAEKVAEMVGQNTQKVEVRGKEMITNTSIGRILNMGTGFRGIELATNQILARGNDSYCKANALSEIAKRTIGKHVNAAGMDFTQKGEADAYMNQAALIYSVIGPKFEKLKNKLDAYEVIVSRYEKNAELQEEIAKTAERIGDKVKEIESLTSGCRTPVEACSGVELSAQAFVSQTRKDVVELTADVEEYSLKSQKDEINDGKNNVLAGKLSHLNAALNTAYDFVSALDPKEIKTMDQAKDEADANSPRSKKIEAINKVKATPATGYTHGKKGHSYDEIKAQTKPAAPKTTDYDHSGYARPTK